MIYRTARKYKFGLQVKEEIRAAQEGRRPELENDTDWYGRAPQDEDFQRRKQQIEDRGLLCQVLPWVSGDNSYPDEPLLGLQVVPIEEALTNAPATHSKVWHISVAFHSTENKELESAFIARYSVPRRLRLLFNRIGWNGVSDLDPVRDPIASDPVVKNLHQASYYKRKPLHICF